MNDGCPACDWDGEIAHTHDYDHNYYTHVIVKDGELFRGKTCSERTKPRKTPLWKRLLGLTPKSRIAKTPDKDPDRGEESI